MKRTLLTILLASALLTGCVRFRAKKAPAQPTSPPTQAAAAAQPVDAATEVRAAPDFSAMTFVEKNNLYLQLLEEQQAVGADIGPAEEAYLQSMQASLAGNSAEADRYLEEAILLLWNK